MKKFLLILAVAIASTGCGVQRARMVEKSFYDYSAYTDEGFFLSPNQYIGEHQPLGELFIKVTPALLPANQAQNREEIPQKRNYSDGLYSNQPSFGKVVPEQIEPGELLEMAVSEAVKRGGNGISNFSVKAIYTTTVTRYATTTELSHYEITGLCIKTM